MASNWPPPLPLNSTNAVSTVACAIVFPTLSTIAVILRFFARHHMGNSYGADDWVAAAALVAVFGQMIIIILSTVYGGVGHHITELSPLHIQAFFKLIAAVQFTFGSSLGLVKISIALLLVRIFFVRKFRILAYCIAGFSVCWMLMVWFIGAGLCRPFAFNWDKTIPGGQCGNLNAAYISIAALDIVGDVMLIALPMPWVWNLRISVLAKLGLSIVFAVGILDIVVAILRIYFLVNTSFSPDSDFTWTVTEVYVWSVIEPSLGVIVACMAIVGPVLRSMLTNAKKSIRSKSTSYQLEDHSNDRHRSHNRFKDEYLLQTRDDFNSSSRELPPDGPSNDIGVVTGHNRRVPQNQDIRIDREFRLSVDPTNK